MKLTFIEWLRSYNKGWKPEFNYIDDNGNWIIKFSEEDSKKIRIEDFLT